MEYLAETRFQFATLRRLLTKVTQVVVVFLFALGVLFGPSAKNASGQGLGFTSEDIDSYSQPSSTSYFTYDGAFGFGLQGRVRHVAGEGIANPHSFTSLEFLKPVIYFWSNHGDEVLGFVDGRYVFQNDRDMAGSIGAGIRTYWAEPDVLLGGSFWYDADDTHENEFHQLGGSGELFTRWFDLRGNYYRPVGSERKTIGFSSVGTAPIFMGTNVLFGRTRFDEIANEGYDAEVAVHIPGEWAERYDLTVGGGYYEFETPEGIEFDGWRARVQGQVFPNLFVQASVTEDDTFGTNYMLTVAWEFTRFTSDQGFRPRNVHDRWGILPNGTATSSSLVIPHLIPWRQT